MKRIVVVLGLAALMVALITGPGSAQAERTREVFEETFPQPGTSLETFFECGDNPEWLTLSGEFKAFSYTLTTPAGEPLFIIHSQTIGQAVGQSTGREFIFHATGTETYHTAPSELLDAQLTLTQFLVSPGPEDNFFIQFTVHADENGELVVDKARFVCRG
jgi:hypothetical protein